MNNKKQHTPDLSQPCIEWVGAIDNDGYGRLNVKNKWRLAHRVEYERLVGIITEGLVIDHLCRNRRCVNALAGIDNPAEWVQWHKNIALANAQLNQQIEQLQAELKQLKTN